MKAYFVFQGFIELLLITAIFIIVTNPEGINLQFGIHTINLLSTTINAQYATFVLAFCMITFFFIFSLSSHIFIRERLEHKSTISTSKLP